MADEQFYGQQPRSAGSSDYNASHFQISQALNSVRTLVPVKIVAVHGGGVAAAPTVDVQPMVNQIDGQGNQTPHGVIFGIPTTRNQGAAAAIINDPKVGDIGHMMIADRDISTLKNNAGAQSNPGSFRTHDMADGVYIGAFLNAATPDRYVNLNGPGIAFQDEFGNKVVTSAGGIALTDSNGNTITMAGGGINMNGVVIGADGSITAPGGIQAGSGGGDSVTMQHHTHGGGPPPDAGT